MKSLFKWFLLLGGTIFVINLAFTLYANFLVDYSLDNLQQALAVTADQPASADPNTQKIYQNMVRGIALEEITKDDPNISNLALLDVASRSIDEAYDRAGFQRANLYIGRVVEEKRANRNPVLRALDQIYYQVKKVWDGFHSMLAYLQKRFFPQTAALEQAEDLESLMIAGRAQEELEGDRLTEAAKLFESFLEKFPQHPDRGYIAVTLAQTYIRQRLFSKAEALLEKTVKDQGQSEEGIVASTLFDRITVLKEKSSLIHVWKQTISQNRTNEIGDQLRLKLAMLYLSAYRFEEAEGFLKDLERSEDRATQQKAKFYLGYLYKINREYEKSASVLSELIGAADLGADLKLGLRAQLADVYYLKRDVTQALHHLQELTSEVESGISGVEAAREAWLSLSNFEQANIYLYDFGDVEKANLHLGQVAAINASLPDINDLRRSFRMYSGDNIRDRAFEALRLGDVRLAYQLFHKNLRSFPKDAWTFSGLGTVYLLFANLDKANEYALDGYRIQRDEYTASVLAYVSGYMGKYKDAIALYKEALEYSPDYQAAHFNLSCMELELRNYQDALNRLAALDQKLDKDQVYMRAKVLNNIGYALWWLGDRKEAVKKFGQAMFISPGFGVAQRNIARVSIGQEPEMVDFKDGKNA